MRLHAFNAKKEYQKLMFKRNNGKDVKYGSIILSVCILVFAIMYFSFSKFSTAKKFNVINANVVDFASGDYRIAYYLDDTLVDTVPTSTSGDGILKITCNNDATATWNKDTWNIEITSNKSGTKCNVYFTSDSTKVDSSYYTPINTNSDDYKAGSNISQTEVIGSLVNGNTGSFTTSKYYKVVVISLAFIYNQDYAYAISITGNYTEKNVASAGTPSNNNSALGSTAYYNVSSGTTFSISLPNPGTHDSLL